MIRSRNNLALLVPFALLVACTSTPFSVAPQEDVSVQPSSGEAVAPENRPINSTASSTVKMQDDLWVGGNAIRISNKKSLPEFFSNPASFYQSEPARFEEIANRLSIEFATRIVVSADATEYLQFLEEQYLSASNSRSGGSAAGFTIEHAGTVASVFDQLTSKANLYWKWDKDQIIIFRHETKTFVVDLLPGQSMFEASTRNSGASSFSTTTQSSPESAWEGLALSVAAMVSSSGRFALSEQAGTLTITDTPTVIGEVDSHVEAINSMAGRKIAVRTEVYEVALNESESPSLDWEAVLDDSQNSEDVRMPGPGVSIIGMDTRFGSADAFIKALSEHASVSLVTSSSAYTTNGQPVPVQVLEETTYLASVGNQAGASSNQAVLTPGVVSSGFSMSLLPRVESDGDIMLQVTMDISELKGISSFGSGSSQIQLPNKSSKTFLQRASLRSGETLIMSGFESPRPRDGIFANKGTGIFGTKQKVMTVILITPYLIER